MPHAGSGLGSKGPGLYEFLVEAELEQYYSSIKNELKIQNVSQLKYAADEDFLQVGFSRPEVRRLRKIFQKYCPQNYLSKFKSIIRTKKDDASGMAVLLPEESTGERAHAVKVPSKHIIPAEAIVINKELGVGEFGVVQQGVWTNEEGDRIQVAIKCLSKERMQSNPMEFLKEAAIMHTIDHEHIVRLYGVVLDTLSLMLVTELAPLRSLLECLKEPALRPSFPVPTLCEFAMQVCDGMQYLESKRLIHRDLAARNILVFTKSKIKISDFGLSRALGVGKDYYQTNFNVNLKLPIAWCAPECINYLRFTSASDVWAFGVTLWEMFSYGFQPWAALTGQQILEAIDEPHYQRLEQPECCPKEYFTLMLKCWQHEPHKRPRFADLLTLLPECKPEQVQAVQDSEEPCKTRRDHLLYQVGDVITVLDKKPLQDSSIYWKGVLLNGKTGLFNPAHTVAYLGKNLPSMKPQFTRGDGKNAYSSKRRLRSDMISSPQGDLKHTGHVGLDGAYFGDVAFLGDKYNQLPKQVVAPYKPQDDQDGGTSPAPSATSFSDRAPLLSRTGDLGKAGPAADHNWSDTASENSAPPTPGFLPSVKSLQPLSTLSTLQRNKAKSDSKEKEIDDRHDYHEISDEETVESPHFEESQFDLGPSLMDEVFRALGTSNSTSQGDLQDEHPGRTSSKSGTLKDTFKKKQATVKPISASDQRRLDQAIAMANDLACKSMQDLDTQSLELGDHLGHLDIDSPHTPNTPSKRKFSFKFGAKTSPKLERRNFSDEAASIPDIQSSLTEESKEAYNTLIEKPVLDNVVLPVAPEPADVEDNPLRMLRSGLTMRPKVRGNKHNSLISPRDTKELDLVAAVSANPKPLTQARLGSQSASPKPRVLNKPSPLFIENSNFDHYQPREDKTPETDADNPIPLPPRDRTKVCPVNKPRHTRKHPLLMPGGFTVEEQGTTTAGTTYGVGQEYRTQPDSPLSATFTTDYSLDGPVEILPMSGAIPPAKPPRATYSLDDSYDSQIASELDALDDIEDETLTSVNNSLLETTLQGSSETRASKITPLYARGDHVSCEDLLEFACDRPNSRRTRGPARGIDSDEVRIMTKVLGKEKATPSECVAALDETQWDMHKGIKLIKLRLLLASSPALTNVELPAAALRDALSLWSWDVAKAASHLISMGHATEDTMKM